MRTVLRAVVALLSLLVLPLAVGAVNASDAFASFYTHRPDAGTPVAAPPAHDPAKPTAVVVVGNEGAEVSDVLAPYEVLATTGAFNVYTAAPQRRAVPLTGGLDLVPDLTFAELDERLGAAAPAVVVVPALPDVGEATTASVTTWLRQQVARGTLLVSVCNGSGVLASAGLLDGRAATAHWARIDSLASDFPTVNWRRGTRYVEDDRIITTAGILSGVEGTLRAVERLVGADAAGRAAQAIGWRHHLAGAPGAIPTSGFDPADAVVALNAGYRWNPPTIGVVLTEGVGELELASVFDTHGGQSMAARTVAVAVDGLAVRSRHGLVFLPRSTVRAAAPAVDRLVVPGTDAAARRDLDLTAPAGTALIPEYLHGAPGFAFDAALRDLARTTDVATARWTAKALEYPTDGLDLTGERWPLWLTFQVVVLALAGLAAAVGAERLRARRRPRARISRPSTGGSVMAGVGGVPAALGPDRRRPVSS